VKIDRGRVPAHFVEQAVDELLDSRTQSRHPACGKRRREQAPHEGMVAALGFWRAHRLAEDRRFGIACGSLGVWVRPTKPRIAQQRPDGGVAGHQPG
jgi:hypothetical protein